ncbi:hypothetical protein RI129_004110 [Pyrocoelia pectoralis]|uniref:C2H2-type domain-containing protein n=1 Tax=Pyrocoelia pectoralis TaxID=417401 RepID=A0AAN7VHY1_9COLE
MSRKIVRRAASQEALKQMQLLSETAYEDDPSDTCQIPSEDDDYMAEDEMPPKKKYRLSHRKSSDGNDRDVIVLKSISTDDTNDEPFVMECEEDELSSVQVEWHNKVQNELDELSKKLDNFSKQSNTEIVHQGEACSIYQIEDISSSTPSVVTETAKAQSGVVPGQPNVVLKPGKQNNSYQLVMDPRLGLIVGTMTPATNKTSPSPTISKSKTPLTTTVTKTQPVRRRGRNSVVPAPSPVKIQKGVPIGPPPLVQLRSADSSAKSNSNTQKTTTPSAAPAVVDLTADDGRPPPDSREISFNKLQGKTFPSLVVVARPHLGVKDITGGDRTKLDSKVKSVLMHIPTKFTEWLIQQGLVRSEQFCVNHSTAKLKLGMYSDVSRFPFSGGYVWISECCPNRFVSVFSGSIFENCPHPPSVILKLIYHWACQTNIQNVVQWVKVDNYYVKGMYTWLRAICTVGLHSHVRPLGGPGRRVEVGVISLGTTSQDGQQRQVKVEVLGLLESEARLIRLRAVEPLADGDRNYKKRFGKILEPLIKWVHPESVIVTDLTVDKGTLNSIGFSNVQQSTSSDITQNNHTIMDYLRRIVPRMFQNTLSLLSRQIIQQFLDELVWREWFGTTAAECFDNLLVHLSEQTRADTGESLPVRLNKVANNPFKNWSILTTEAPTTIINKSNPPPLVETNSSSGGVKRTSSRQRKIMNFKSDSPSPTLEMQQKPPRTISPDVPEQMVHLENYYYGTIQGTQQNTTPKLGFNLKCTMCKSHFSNNIRLMNHLFSHAHSVTGGIQQCRYCLSSVGSPEGLSKHIVSSHPSETRFQEAYICIICETRFANSFSLGKHLSKEHVPAELPYQCGTCGYRCSSHRQVIDHFYNDHDNGSTIQCPFCLKSTSICTGGRVMPQNLNYFMQHLQKHQKKTMAKKCPKCALWFIHKDTLKEHQFNMHSSQRSKSGLISWTPPKNGLMVPKSKQDKQVWEDTEREINFSNLTIINAPSKLVCKECKFSINASEHFQSLDGCPNRNCQYSTCCKAAMETHISMCVQLNESLPISTLGRQMFCVCGYSDDDGNMLASHLAKCERKSAYPSAEDAKKAIKTHSMLDVLGLVRRPEEPSNTPQVVDIIDLDKDEIEETQKTNTKKTKRPNSSKDKSIEKKDVKPNKRLKKEISKSEEIVEINDEDEKENKDLKQEEMEKISKLNDEEDKKSDREPSSPDDVSLVKDNDSSKENENNHTEAISVEPSLDEVATNDELKETNDELKEMNDELNRDER